MYRKRLEGWLKHLDFILLDILCLEIGFFVAYWLWVGNSHPLENDAYREIFFVIALVDMMVIVFGSMMEDILKRGYWKEFIATVSQSVWVFVFTTAYMFIIKEGAAYSRIAISLTVVFYAVLSYIGRVLLKRLLKRVHKSISTKAMIVIAPQDSMEYSLKKLDENNFGHYRVVGVVPYENAEVGTELFGVPVVTDINNLPEYIVKNWVDEVLWVFRQSDTISGDLIDTLVSMGVTVHTAMNQAFMSVGIKQVISNIGGHVVVTNTMNYMSAEQAFIKRTADIIGALFGCILTGILYLFIAPAIKIQSPGPVFFKQTRIGRNGKKFTFYKFRSMYMDAEERKKELMAQNQIKDGMMFKMDFDPRVIGNKIDKDGNKKTGIGDFIRRTSLDEFPQFFNVLKGDMSLVGTRPPVIEEYEAYSAHHKARLATRPGITGLWQVSGRSNIHDFEEVVKLDTQYINNWSIGLDIRIILKTIAVVLKKEGAK